MTAIVYSDGVLAADRMSTGGLNEARFKSYATKLIACTDGVTEEPCIVTSAGYTNGRRKFIMWLECSGNLVGPFRTQAMSYNPDEICNEMDIVVFYPLGDNPRLVFYDSGVPTNIYCNSGEHHEAWGSGYNAAHTALYLGKTAIEAVEVASDLIVNCGGGVDYVQVGSMDINHIPPKPFLHTKGGLTA